MKKLTINRQALLSNLKHGISIVPKVSITMPAYTCFLLRKSGENVLIKCASHEMEVISEFKQQKGDDMEVIIEADLFFSTLSAMKDEEVTINVSDNFRTQIVAGKKKYNIPSYEPKDFPKMHFPDAMKTAHFVPENILPYMKKALTAVNTKDGSDAYRMVELMVNDKKMTVTGCHQHMIFQSEAPTEQENCVFYFNNNTINLLVAIDNKESISISTDDKRTKLSVNVGNITINTLSLNGTYARVAPLFEPNRDLIISINKIDIIETLKRLRNFTDERGSVLFQISENGVSFVSEFLEAGKRAEEELVAATTNPFPPQRMLLKSLITAIENIDCDSIDICLNEKDNIFPIIQGSFPASVSERYIVAKMKQL